MNTPKERFIKLLFTAAAFSSLALLAGIIIVLFREALPVFSFVSPLAFLGGESWYPTAEPPEFGIWPLIAASAWVTGIALVICVPLGVGSALYLHELAGPRQRAVLKPVIEVLASVPSIIYGFFGMTVMAPFMQEAFGLPIGLCALTAGVILGVMATPTVASIAEDALGYVPRSFREASFALGANRWETLVKVIIPAAGSGISTAIILGMSRAIGETMTVLMVAGGAAVVPASVFDPVRPMTAAIAAEMGEAAVGGEHYHALFAIALALFLVTFVFNAAAELISRRYRLKLGLAR
ncbi:MAG: phosphate transport system permease protein [Elusimicrobia bacterium]|nr:MAG: phosphate transport system permease protein [Elusimicrobiota bacterium]KAF0155102.1 MAG: phosphate transport system permease protein [Elusimicrobiota bacterium]